MTLHRLIGYVFTAGALLGPAQAAAQTPTKPAPQPTKLPYEKDLSTNWVIDGAHARVSFQVRHLVGRVTGDFTNWTGTLRTNGVDWTRGIADVTIQTNSLNTLNAARDADLKSARFFDVKKFPTILFTSTGLVKDGQKVEMGGLLTIKGITKSVALKCEFLGRGKGQDGKERMGFLATTVIERKDFGLVYNELIDGLPLVGDQATITIEFEAVQKEG